MIALFVPPESARAAEIPKLLEYATTAIAHELSEVEIRLAGIACRLALEFHLREMCRRHQAKTYGMKWHDFAIRLLKAEAIDMATYRHVRRIFRLAGKAVHGRPWCRERAERLLELVLEIVEQ